MGTKKNYTRQPKNLPYFKFDLKAETQYTKKHKNFMKQKKSKNFTSINKI